MPTPAEIAAALVNVKAFAVDNEIIKTFNVNNRWEDIGNISTLTHALFASNALSYNVLNTSYDNIKLRYTYTQTLADGSLVYQSEPLNSAMGITKLENIYEGGVDKLKATVPAFLPKDSLTSSSLIYCYTTDAAFKPYVYSVVFDKTNTHSSTINFVMKCVYNYDEPIQYRFNLNGGAFSNWSTSISPYKNFTGQIPPASLKLGANAVNFEVRTADTLKTTTYSIANAITVDNNTPSIIFVTADSNSFKLHYRIADVDVNDTIKYRILLNNSKNVNRVLQNWSGNTISPIENIYYIDTTYIVPDETNTITVEYKDNLMTTANSATYSFIGKYKNIVFFDETRAYYTTDTGIVLKLLDFSQMVAGSESEARPITLKNDSPTAISNLRLDTDYTQAISGVSVKYSKTQYPFIPLSSLDYGTEEIAVGTEKTFYVKVDSVLSSEGLCTFNITAMSSPVL